MLLGVLQILAVAALTWLLARVHWFRGIRVASFSASLVLTALVAVTYAVLNYVAASLNWVTLGMFGIVVGAVAVELADFFVTGVEVDGFWWALALSLLVAATNSAIELLLAGVLA